MHTGLLLEMAADGLGERHAAGPLASAVSYADLLARARAGGAWLAAQPGATVVQIGQNSPALPLLVFAAAFAGKAFAPLNYRLADADLTRILARTAPSIAVVDEDMIARVEGAPGVTIVPRAAFAAVCADPANQAIAPPEFDPDIAVLLFTSGTTGEPKAAILRHEHLTAYVLSTVEFMGAAQGEAALVSVPPYHIAGISAVLTNIFAGRRIVHLPAFSPEAWVEAAAAEAVTHAMVVPTMLGRILDVLEARGEPLPALKALSYGGGRMPPPVIQRALRLMPQVDFVNAYGLTETSSTISVLGPEDHHAARAGDPVALRRLSSVGRPLPGLEVEIRDPTGAPVPAGVSGEVCVRGDQISGEYVGRKLTDAEGWFHTRDAGFIDAGGYLFLEGRLDDVIVRGGENISPGEVEDVLRAHPAVADAAVLGAPSDQWGERVVAVVVPRGDPDPEALKAFVRERLRSTKAPEEIRFQDALPYNETGKLLRRALKGQFA
ncbi:class I adenylate-forming enzyme family protein [Phenylobacterium montanum]|uniref:Long-chain fatty acid--CoA ligase n=1 Tax=Phenylobacterium montanum TaxID=2823693 RepID=A0A975G4D8_9CAUL|nr:fatty acid--CoA ligase family protein [Caulobacter sp. S6]QUD90367.1 long-chain fatty acid--CoA ligase [Caulobacter sp. S6]